MRTVMLGAVYFKVFEAAEISSRDIFMLQILLQLKLLEGDFSYVDNAVYRERVKHCYVKISKYF